MGKDKTWERRAEEVRRKHRPKLRNWMRDKFGHQRQQDFLKLRDSAHGFIDSFPLRRDSNFDASKLVAVERIPCQSLSISDFVRTSLFRFPACF